MNRFSVVLVFVLVAFGAYAESPLTNADVLRLAQAGLSAETIIAKIEASDVAFDISTDALIVAKKEGVPDAVIGAMIRRASESAARPSASPSPAAPAASPVEPAAKPFRSKRFEVTVHSTKYAGCPGGELLVTATRLETTRCRSVDFRLKWADVVSVCYEYGTTGVMVVNTASGRHRVSTVTPMQMKEIAETVRRANPQIRELERCD